MQNNLSLRVYRFLYASRFGLMAVQSLMSAVALWVLPPLPGLIIAVLALLPAMGMLGLVVAQMRLDNVRFKAHGPLSLFYLLFGLASYTAALLAVLLQPIVLSSSVLAYSTVLIIGIGGISLTLLAFDAIFGKAFTQAWADSYTDT